MSQVFSAVASCPAHPELRISFTAKDPSSIKDALLCEATANARKKAELLCNASGAKLGQLLTIEYNWGELDIHSNSKYKMDGDRYCDIISQMITSIEIEPENIDVCDTATFVWEIG